MSLHSRLTSALCGSAFSLVASVAFAQPSAPLRYTTFRVECIKKIEVAAQADGLIAELGVEEGSHVPSGGLLFRIDNRVAKAQLQIAEKELESAKKQAEQDADVKFAKATYKVAQAEAQAEQYLIEKNSSNVANLRRKVLEQEKAGLQIEVAEVKRETDRLAVNVAEAKRDAANVQLSLYDIVAPWDAIVNERLKTQGAWIRAGEPVLKIHHMEEMRVSGFVNYEDVQTHGKAISDLENAPIEITVQITPADRRTVKSVISFVSSEIDDANRIRVWANVKNDRVGNSWLLRDGQKVEVVISGR